MQTRVSQRALSAIMLAGLLGSFLSIRREDIQTYLLATLTPETLHSVIGAMQAAPFWPVWLGSIVVLGALFGGH